MNIHAIRYNPDDFQQVYDLGKILEQALTDPEYRKHCESNLGFVLSTFLFVNEISEGTIFMPGDWEGMGRLVAAWLKTHAFINGGDEPENCMIFEIPRRN